MVKAITSLYFGLDRRIRKGRALFPKYKKITNVKY